MSRPPVVSREQWLVERERLLEKERALSHAREELAALRRRLPWVKIEKEYVFDGREGQRSLRDLFGRRGQLIVYHFMFDPDWDEGCSSCSFWADNFAGAIPHLAQRDVAMVAISRAPVEKITAFQTRMAWSFEWVSSYKNDFNRDFGVSLTPDERTRKHYNYGRTHFPGSEAPGLSVFVKGDSEVFHTYSTYSRGLDMVNGAYQLLDLVPKGRDEAGLEHPQDWVDFRDRYDRFEVPLEGLRRRS
jgi:predicted dithiol-disulfide oxidoreductase (DUF899 family)